MASVEEVRASRPMQMQVVDLVKQLADEFSMLQQENSELKNSILTGELTGKAACVMEHHISRSPKAHSGNHTPVTEGPTRRVISDKITDTSSWSAELPSYKIQESGMTKNDSAISARSSDPEGSAVSEPSPALRTVANPTLPFPTSKAKLEVPEHPHMVPTSPSTISPESPGNPPPHLNSKVKFADGIKVHHSEEAERKISNISGNSSPNKVTKGPSARSAISAKSAHTAWSSASGWSNPAREGQGNRKETITTKGGAFANVDKMKEKVRQSLETQQTSEMRTMSFKEDHKLSAFVQGKVFEVVSTSVVCLNAIWIAIDTDYNKAVVLSEADPIFQVAEHSFCFFFVGELFLRIFALKRAWGGFRDPWFRFDFLLVAMMVVETWIVTAILALVGGTSGVDLSMISVLRILRLTRLTRLTRLMRTVPELLFMLKGMLEATRSVLWTLALLVALLYVFGITMCQLSADTKFGKKYFDSVSASMYTLLLDGTFLDSTGTTLQDIRKESVICTIIFMLLIVFASLVLLNMLIGVLCEVVSAVAATEKESLVVAYVKDQVRIVIEDLDEDHDGLISKEEFEHIMFHEDAIQALHSVNVDVEALVSYADYIFQSDDKGQVFDKELDFHDFMGIVLKLRGDQPATVRDIVDLRRFIHDENTNRNIKLGEIKDTTDYLDYAHEQYQKQLYKNLGKLRKTVDGLTTQVSLGAAD